MFLQVEDIGIFGLMGQHVFCYRALYFSLLKSITMCCIHLFFFEICMGQIGSSLFVVLSCSGLVSDCFYGFLQEGQRQDGRV